MTNTLLTLHDPALARRYYAEGLWRKDTLYTLLCGHAARRPEAFAVRDSRRRLSWSELRGMVDAVAADLDEAGLKRGERVSVWLPNRVEAVAILLACSRQGYVCNPSLHQNYTVGEITELLSRIRAAAFFTEPGHGADARTADIFAAAAALPSMRRIYTLGTGPRSAAPFPEVALAASLPPPDDDPDKVVYLAFTSGTTGTPKGVMHSDNTLLANARAMVEDWHHDERSILLILSPLKTFYMAGSPIPREVAQAFLARGVIPQNVYGMSENSSHQYTLPSDPAETIVATCGRACRAYEIRLWDQENPDIEVAPGEIGEIGGRGACLMLGYFDNQEATEDSFNRGGWFMSGDLGRFDADGNLEIVGRKKDLIIRGGHNIHPAKIEDLTMRHSAVARVAAFAVADQQLGEKVCLSVIFHDGAGAEADELLAHLNAAGLSRYDMPEYFIAMTAYPLTASGKILKRELVEWAKSGHIRPQPVRWTEPARDNES